MRGFDDSLLMVDKKVTVMLRGSFKGKLEEREKNSN
jgi:hypothetical protein